jgi:hypothetical protein
MTDLRSLLFKRHPAVLVYYYGVRSLEKQREIVQLTDMQQPTPICTAAA